MGLIILILIILFGLGCTLWALNDILNDYINFKLRKAFTKDFEDCVKHSQPSWDEVKEIASVSGVTHQAVQKSLKNLHVQIMAGRNTDLEPHKQLLESYIQNYKTEEPFEGIPNEIRMHLERLRENFDGKELLLEPLTSQIRELLSIKQKEVKQQKWYTIGGFVIGVAGLIFAIFTYYTQLPQLKLANTSKGNTAIMRNISSNQGDVR